MESALCPEPAVGLPVKEVFYRVAQEAMHNAAVHARPTRLALTLTYNDGCLALSVEDDGPGFDPAAAYPGHLGLRSVRERAGCIGTELIIESAPGATRVRLTYPAESHLEPFNP